MLEKLQRFGAAMFVPVLLFPFAGMSVAFVLILQNPSLVGDTIANPDSTFYKLMGIFLEGGWTIFRNMPLIFAVGLPISLAKKANARAVLAVLVSYLTFNYYIGGFLTVWGPQFGVDFNQEVGGVSGLTMIAGIKTLDTSIIGAIAISGICVAVHNRFFDTKLPDWLGIFQGTSFVTIICFFLMFPMALMTVIVWPMIQQGIMSLQNLMVQSGFIGVWVYTFLERILIPTGLHHFIYGPFVFGPAVVEGGIAQYWMTHLQEFSMSTESVKSLFPQGGFALHGQSKIFGIPGIALAMYYTARPENRKMLSALLIPATLTAMLVGITEPLEFTFLFIAPLLFLVHALLAATLAMVLYIFGVVGNLGGGLLDGASLVWLPLIKNHTGLVIGNIVIGLVFTGIYFIVFRYLILKLDIKTPGRSEEKAKLYTKKDFKEKQASEKSEKHESIYVMRAKAFIELLGGAENIVSVSNCATRLRLNVVDEHLVQGADIFKEYGALGLVKNMQAIQVIVGLDVPNVKEEFDKLI